ncbi:serine hydrolase domain-containing protein [Vagococcus carniphilus]|uniref:Beta-lactamase-related domain-containing protein n=1 Tax=Vagococcus carniphilus TaxID=218144 RepID=A0A430ASM4_9ENTE|nr:serine hydrolase [Vagococcus carniphilus]QNN73206.1 beta-lactamase family protein [Vagococcus carniphilus]RSU11065.1 hypothetical protein CBF28_12500 [Vagococcus carniphilus]
MEPSKVTTNLLRKRLKRQRRKTVILFFIGLLLGGAIAFNVYFWFPILKKEFDLPEIKQYGLNTTQSSISSTDTTSSSTETEQTTESSIEMEENQFIPRVSTANYQDISSLHTDLSKQLDQKISQTNSSGTFLVIKNNQVVLMDNYGNTKDYSNNPIDSTYMLGSVQKLVTATLLMSLIEEGKIELETTLDTYYPDIPNSKNITIDQMLSMTSGLVLKEKLSSTKSKDESIAYVLKNVTYEKQTKWHYSDVNFFLLAAIIEKITHTSYEQYFDEIIKTPLNLEHSGFYNHVQQETHLIPSYYKEDDGTVKREPVKISEATYINELGTGNMYTSVSDLLTLIQAVIDGRVISQETLQKTLEKKPGPYFYDYKAGIYDRENNYYAHGVFRGYESTLFFNKDASNMVIFLSNINEKDRSSIALSKELFQQINQIQ